MCSQVKCTSFMVTHTHNFYWCSKSFCCCCFFFVLFHHHHHHQMVRKKEKFKTFQKKKITMCSRSILFYTNIQEIQSCQNHFLFVCLFVCPFYLSLLYEKKTRKHIIFQKREREREKILKYLKYTSVTQLVKKRITNDNQTHTHTEFLTLFLF